MNLSKVMVDFVTEGSLTLLGFVRLSRKDLSPATEIPFLTIDPEVL